VRSAVTLTDWPVITFLIVVFIVLANFSSTDTIFRCEGKLGEQAETRPATLFMTLTEYRLWVRLWSKSDGMVLIEAPKEGIPYEPYLGVSNVGNSARHIYADSDAESLKGLRGAYYKVSGYLMLDTSQGHFEGNCTPSHGR
jgi:hypothetical protein